MESHWLYSKRESVLWTCIILTEYFNQLEGGYYNVKKAAK